MNSYRDKTELQKMLLYQPENSNILAKNLILILRTTVNDAFITVNTTSRKSTQKSLV